jgi:hypothetical protein
MCIRFLILTALDAVNRIDLSHCTDRALTATARSPHYDDNDDLTVVNGTTFSLYLDIDASVLLFHCARVNWFLSIISCCIADNYIRDIEAGAAREAMLPRPVGQAS